MASASSSSGSVPNSPRKYDVFISFRGVDTRNNFISHLDAALNRAFLEVFRDDKNLEKGDEIAPSLLQAIKDSSISIVVFSENYASSKWCLDDLDQIMQYRKDKGQFVIPIYYKVQPSHVRNQTGAYKEAFEKHENNYQHDPDRVNRWRAALSEASKLSGWYCNTSTDESKLIQEIVTDVSTKLELIHNCHVTLKDVIGIGEMVKPIKKLLKKSHKVGIWGMGGVGKTTMAKVVFAKLSYRYDNCCFLENIREETEKKGLKHVRDSLVSKLLGKDMQIDLSNEEFVFRRLGRTKAFVVLDDVATTEQLENLQDNTCNFLGEGSKVIITTRDLKLLRGKGYVIHKAEGLSYENSRRLFIRKAFGSDNAEDGYEGLIKGFVDYTQHNPLALEVLGLYVHSVDKKLWGDLLRNQTGAYKKAFEKHEIDYPDRVNKWRAALSEAGQLSGWDCKTSMDESALIQDIVTDVSTKLECIYDCRGTLKGVIGIDEMIEPIEELLEKSHKVGIWGMGGVGKTTMAKAVFAKLSYRYDNCCFLENVREKTEKNGAEHVRNSLISKLLGQDMQNDPSNASRNNAYVVRRLGTKKVLVVLDDVDSLKLLEYLQENICNFLAEGSKVIITTRDMQLLRANNYEIHEAKGLSFENSLQLFVSKAFRSEHPKDGYEELINGFVHYTQHNPLALKVLGSLVRSVHKEVWDDLLRKLMAGNPNDKIQKVLELSYNGLDHKEQQLFLDIACFLKGESEEFVEELLESYDFYPTNGMQTLKDKALIVTTDGKVDMHDLIQEMGHQIVHKESIKEPGKRSRLWDTGEIFDVFENCEGGQNVEGIILLDRYATGASYLTAKTFNKMMRLRFLKIHSPWDYDMSTTATGLESISTQIRYFHWECYPMKSLPSNFCAEHLLELNLNRSWVETLWEGVQDLAKLRRLKLQWCRNLRELPDFSKACRLESVDLRGCESLCYVHASLLSLDSLISLDVGHCWSLESLQSRIQLISLKEIIIDMCYNLKEFSVSSKELTSLDLSGTMIEELSLSIGLCSKLTTLYLPDKKLKNLPIKVLSGLTSLKELRISLLEIDNVDLRVLFDRLRSLQSLSLRKCRNLTELPDNITQLSCLEKLHLAKCPNLTKLPVNMRLLAKLQHLSVKGCTALHSLPELPPSLRKLYATNCTSLETVSPSTISSTTQNKGEKVFSFKNCLKLDLGAIEEQVKLLLEKAIHENEDVEVYFPGKKVPEWFGNNQTQNDSDTLKLCLSSHTSVGFIFCAVAPDFLKEELSGYLHIAFCVDEDEMTKEVVEFPELTYFTDGNVLVRSYPKASESIREKIEGKRRNHDATTYNPNLFFKFSFTSGFCSKPIEECGVFPLYTSGNSELNSNSRKRKAVMI